MKAPHFFIALAGTCLSLAAPLQAQFVSFNPDSFGEFYTVSTPENSFLGANATGVAVSGEFQWDSTRLWLRVVINNLAGTGDYPTGTLTSFGFKAPSFDNVQLAHYGIYDQDDGALADRGNLRFTIADPYNLTAPSLRMDVGAGTWWWPYFPSLGLRAGDSAYFDFAFTGIDPADFSFDGFGYSQVPEGDFTISFVFQGMGKKGYGYDKFGGYVVPEPSFYGMAGMSLLGLLIVARRLKRNR